MEKAQVYESQLEDTPSHPKASVAQNESAANGDAILITADGHVQRLPIPSASPNDPLNFRRWEKALITFNCCWFSIMSLALSGGLGAILVTFIELYTPQGYSINEVVRLATFPSLFIGIGNLIILPLALVFGRRPVFLCSILGLFLATIGAAVQNSYEAHLAARIIQGLTTGATESLLPLIITEITFVHQRSLAFGFYWATQSAFSSLLNLASSYETASLSWRWYYWVYVFTIGFGFVTAVFGTFETRFKRPAFAFQGQCIVTDEFGVTRTLQGDEATAFFEASQIDSADMDMTRKSYIQKLTPYSGVADHPARIMLKCWLNMLKSLSSPGIVYALLLSAAVLGCAVGVSLTYNTVLQEIYGWPAANVGLINIGGVIGAFLGMAYAGWPADKYTVWLARRNGGIHKPEHRLLMLPLVGIVGLAALLLYGFTASGNATWWGPYIGWTLYQFCFVSILIVTTSFAAESWPQDPGPALVMVVGAKNIIAFGVSYGLIPMIAKYGYKESLGILAGVHTGIFLLGIPTYYLNPMWRKKFLNRSPVAPQLV